VEIALAVLGIALALFAVALTIAIERLKRPRLTIRTSTFQPSEPITWTFAAVRVVNDPRLPKGLGSIITRQSADGCAVTLEFRRRGEKALAFPPVDGRWSSQPEPLRREPVAIQPTEVGGGISLAGPAPTQIQFVESFDLGMAMSARRLNVSPGHDGEEVAVAVLKDDGKAYAWGAESYAYPGWAHPEWELQRGEYELTVRVTAAGVETERPFLLPFLSNDFARFKTSVTKD
jgi:hypothetical protein